MHWTAPLALAGLLALAQEKPSSEPKDFGKPYVLKVHAKTRYSTSFKQADFDRELRKHADEIRYKGRAPIENDPAGWDVWTFECAESWSLELDVVQLIFGRHIIIRRYDIEVEGTVKADAQKTYWLTHASKKRFRLSNRPKLPKETETPPDLRSKVDAAVKRGHKTFKVSGEVILTPTPAVLMEEAEATDEAKKE